MIYLSPLAGLGNQMFQYAYARALSEEFNDPEIVINPYLNRIFKFYTRITAGKTESLCNDLDLFELNSNISTISPLKGWAKGIADIVPSSLIRFGILKTNTTPEKYKKTTEKGNFKLIEKIHTYYEHSDVCRSKVKNVYGWFESGKYFSNIRPILLKEFQFKKPASQRNQEMMEELSSCNSVCVHVRRGDLLLPYYSYIPMATEGYYRQGIEYVAERINDPVFYIFSNTHDDIEWIKNNYDFGRPVKYVDLSNPGHDDLRLMYHCKHFVISKSSFSWWGSYMSENEDKIVVAPVMEIGGTWVKDENCYDLYRDDMIKIHLNGEEKK